MKSENGITLLALIVTLTVIAIIGLTVVYTGRNVKQNTNDDVLLMELQTVHHIVLQEYNKKLTLGDDYKVVGVKVANISTYNSNFENKLSNENTYYILDIYDLESIGAKNVGSNYLVCYETGEVANITKYSTSTGEVLYTK